MAKAFILILAVLLALSMACVQQARPAQVEQNNTGANIAPQNQTPAENASPQFVRLNTVPALRVKNLARGVNVANWFWYPASGDARRFGDYLSDTELEWLKARGFTFIRLPIDPKWLYLEGEAGMPNATNLAYINRAVERVLDHKLSIILELHENDWQRLEGDAAYDDGLVKLWSALAKNWSRYDADRVFFEPVNEPRYYIHPQDWAPLQQRFVDAIRSEAPNHTIFATGPIMSSIEGLMLTRPLADSNIIYTFHFYDPSAFTHQGAAWLPGGFDQIRNLRYPYEEQNGKEVLA
ncbi:MAG TPA: cellulase family glycosylhydrolase, partial [Candidatus Micrarchaeota archaeon]|nr:cellulase family glycosylhydrolase [Candidatus Micrarchaeota archaeon]